VSQSQLRARQLERALKEAVVKMWNILFLTGDSEIEIDLIVVGLDVFVGNRPILTITVVGFGLEIVVRKP
jgi:hypothetical protein